MDYKDYVGCIMGKDMDNLWIIAEIEQAPAFDNHFAKYRFYYCTEDGTILPKEEELYEKKSPYRSWTCRKKDLEEYFYKKSVFVPPNKVDKVTRKIKQMAARQKWQPA